MVPSKYANVQGGEVHIEKHAIKAAGSIILPGVTINEGACIGAMSLVKKDIDPLMLYAGVPAKLIGPQNKEIIDLEKQFLNENN